MFFTSRQYHCVRHMVMANSFQPFNHCQCSWFCSSHCQQYGYFQHCQYGYGQPLSTIVNMVNHVNHGHGHGHIVNMVMANHWSISLCSSHCDNMDMANHVQPLSTMVNHSQPWSWSIKVNHIYVRHIATIWLCSSHRMFSV
jgi:hypothetical protein